MIGFSEGRGIVRAGAVIVNGGGELIWSPGVRPRAGTFQQPRQVGPKIVIAIGVERGDTTDVCKIASPFQDMVNPQVNLFQ